MTHISAFLGVITTTFSTTITGAVSVNDLQFLRLSRFTIRSSSKLNFFPDSVFHNFAIHI